MWDLGGVGARTLMRRLMNEIVDEVAAFWEKRVTRLFCGIGGKLLRNVCKKSFCILNFLCSIEVRLESMQEYSSIM